MRLMRNKIVNFDQMRKLNSSILNKKTVLVGGCFDIFHFGHLLFLEGAQKEGDILIIALESDEFIRTHKKKEPFHTQKERAQILAGLEVVDYVLLLPLFTAEKAYSDLVESLRPGIIAVTEGDKVIEKKQEQAVKAGGKLKVVCPQYIKHSSSRLNSYASFFNS